jgi:hypothetical protein
MWSIGLWRWYINITIIILGIIHRPVFHLKYDDSGTGFYLRLKAQPTQLRPIDLASASTQRQTQGLALSTGLNSTGPIWRRKQDPGSETLGLHKIRKTNNVPNRVIKKEERFAILTMVTIKVAILRHVTRAKSEPKILRSVQWTAFGKDSSSSERTVIQGPVLFRYWGCTHSRVGS